MHVLQYDKVSPYAASGSSSSELHFDMQRLVGRGMPEVLCKRLFLAAQQPRNQRKLSEEDFVCFLATVKVLTRLPHIST